MNIANEKKERFKSIKYKNVSVTLINIVKYLKNESSKIEEIV
jgi:hypothetical protein